MRLLGDTATNTFAAIAIAKLSTVKLVLMLNRFRCCNRCWNQQGDCDMEGQSKDASFSWYTEGCSDFQISEMRGYEWML